MHTQILTPDQLEEAAALLHRGEIVAFPTETVYGLGARIFDQPAIDKIFQVKGRPSDNPLIAHLSSLDQLSQVAQEIPDDFFRLADVFFPGPLTLVLRRHPAVPAKVSAGLDTIALRMPAHPVARGLITALGEPVVAPSANLSGKPSSTSAAHVLEDFSGKIAAVIDGGVSEVGIESTVMSLIDPSFPVLLRLGTIRKQQLEAVLGKPIEMASSTTPTASPGMKYRHYAPRATVRLFCDLHALRAYHTHPDKQMIIADELSAHSLYALLRLADAHSKEEVLIFCSDTTRADAALMDRLTKASQAKF